MVIAHTLDTNGVLSALLWRGGSWRLRAGLSRRPGVRLYSSPALIDELSDVLSRLRVATRLTLLGRSVEQVLGSARFRRRGAGRRAITAETAVRLGLAFGMDPRLWLDLQAQHDLEVVQRERCARLADEVRALAA